MLHAGINGSLELRQDGGETRLTGSFPYGRETVLWDGGRSGQARKELIAARAFSRRIDAGEDIHFLAQHDFDRPLASRSAGTLTIRDDDSALTFEARIAPDMLGVTWVADLLSAVRSGLIRGLSPGFRVPDEDGAEDVRSDGSALLRMVRTADLFEVSAVTRPAYEGAQIEARNWVPDDYSRPDMNQTLKGWLL